MWTDRGSGKVFLIKAAPDSMTTHVGDPARDPRSVTRLRDTAMASQKQIDANRRNAQLSTGPKTFEGKSISRRNSLLHGLSGAGTILPEDMRSELAGQFSVLAKKLRPMDQAE